MDKPVVFHTKLDASGTWGKMSFSEQMGNVGSEIHRALKWREKNKPELEQKAIERGLELLDMTVAAEGEHGVGEARLRELRRLRETLCDFFFGAQQYYSDAASINRYFDCFAFKAAKLREKNA